MVTEPYLLTLSILLFVCTVPLETTFELVVDWWKNRWRLLPAIDPSIQPSIVPWQL